MIFSCFVGIIRVLTFDVIKSYKIVGDIGVHEFLRCRWRPDMYTLFVVSRLYSFILSVTFARQSCIDFYNMKILVVSQS
jgi:hypothetical protein